MLNHLTWRCAMKKFDPSKKISAHEFSELLETLRLSPSSYGLQPWKFVVVQDPKLRQALRPFARNQAQITDASHLIVLCCLLTMDEPYVKNHIRRIAATRQVTLESLQEYETRILTMLKTHTPESLSGWMQRQVYLALGMLLSECAHRGIDACPMEAFEPRKFNDILRLEKYGVEATILCAVGYRSAEDTYSAFPKVRFKPEEVILTV